MAEDSLFDVEPGSFELSVGEEMVVEGTFLCDRGGPQYGEYTVSAGDQVVNELSMAICFGKGGGDGDDDDDDSDNPWVQPRDHVWLSPHLTTSDGLAYDYYASGDYILSTIPGADDYEIQARFLPGYDVSWPQAAAMQVGSDVIEIYAEPFEVEASYTSPRLRIYVNGKEFIQAGFYHSALDNRITTLPGGGRLIIHDTLARGSGWRVDPVSVFVVWPPGDGSYRHVVRVKSFASFEEEDYDYFVEVPPVLDIAIERDVEFAGLERGLLGNNDGDPSNDFMRRNGEVLDATSAPLSWTALYGLFGGDWLVRPEECLFTRGCIEPQFPDSPATLSAQQKTFAEIACEGLHDWYYDACLHDVGLTGEAKLVQEYYADTEDLNRLAGLITPLDGETGVYQAIFGGLSEDEQSTPETPVYSRNLDVNPVSGNGDYLLIARPPRGATVTFANGETSVRGNGFLETNFTLDCRVPDPAWEPLGDAWPERGHIQLWSVDGLSGNVEHLLAQQSLNCHLSHVVLNDTGVTQCIEIEWGWTGGVGACPKNDIEWQDGDFGRDKKAVNSELDKLGSGQAGFDFTKLDENGVPLDEDAEEWHCVRDNHTGLVWESKIDNPESLHAIQHKYTWYNSDPLMNGGDPGDLGAAEGPDWDPRSSCGDHHPCNTEHFVEQVNQAGLCGYSDWRMPSVNELVSIRIMMDDYAFDPVFFQQERSYFEGNDHWDNWRDTWFWARESDVDGSGAWIVKYDLRDMNSHANSPEALLEIAGKGEFFPVRLVRDGSD